MTDPTRSASHDRPGRPPIIARIPVRDTPELVASRRRLLGTVAGLTTGALAGCTGMLTTSDGPSVSYRHRYDRSGIGSAGYDAGVEFGIWEEEGIEVEFLISPGSEAASQSVAGGEDEFANSEIAAVLQLIEKGAPLEIIAQETTPMGGVISLRETRISSWSDLEGRVVGRFPWGVTGTLAAAALRANGADPNNVEWRNVEPGADEVLLMEGELDAAVVYYPQRVARLAHNGFETTVLALSDVLDHLGNVVITNQDYIESYPERISTFIRGWLLAQQRFITDTEAVIDVHREKVAVFDEATERAALGPVFASRVAPDIELEHGMGWTSFDRLDNTISVLREAGVLGGGLDPGDLYTNAFIEDNQALAIETAELYTELIPKSFDISPDFV